MSGVSLLSVSSVIAGLWKIKLKRTALVLSSSLFCQTSCPIANGLHNWQYDSINQQSVSQAINRLRNSC